MYEEFKVYKDIEIIFTRLSKPLLNTLDLPLSGLYTDINKSEYPNFPLKNKFKNFGISYPDYINTNNIFQLNSSLGGLLTGEIIEGLVILTNVSKNQVIVFNLEIAFNFEVPLSEKNKDSEKYKKSLPIMLPRPDNSLLLLPNHSYSIKIRNYLKYPGKCTINVNYKTKSPFYTHQYFTLRQRGRIKENNKEFIINKDKEIEFMFNKNIPFQVSNPFSIIKNSE